MLAGLDTGFDPSNDHAAAVRYLKEQGVEHNNRAVDEKKGFPKKLFAEETTGEGKKK